MELFVLFMVLALVAWLVAVAPAALDLGRLIGKPPGTDLAAWLVAGLMGHDDHAEDIHPQATWACSKGEALASTSWNAAFTWVAANPATVLGGALGLGLGVAAGIMVPESLGLGAIVLVRGLPGSGKSTWAASMASADRLDGYQARVVSADDYFTVRNPQGLVAYLFDSAQLPQAHADCLRRAKVGHAAGETVYVANTFTQAWEMSPYLELDPEAEVYVCPPVPGRLGVHGVPQEAWDRMAARWEAHPREFRLDPQGVPCTCEYCGFLRRQDPLASECQACGFITGRVFPWAGPGNYFRSNGQASVSLRQCATPDELTYELRESQGTADWRTWRIVRC